MPKRILLPLILLIVSVTTLFSDSIARLLTAETALKRIDVQALEHESGYTQVLSQSDSFTVTGVRVISEEPHKSMIEVSYINDIPPHIRVTIGATQRQSDGSSFSWIAYGPDGAPGPGPGKATIRLTVSSNMDTAACKDGIYSDSILINAYNNEGGDSIQEALFSYPKTWYPSTCP